MRILIAVAHADDETLGCFSVLSAGEHEVHILHATDSAPRDPKYAIRSGYPDRESYRNARHGELDRLLQRARIPPERYHCLDIADQEVPLQWPRVREFVAAFRADRVYTHAYEGGHPDHDAVSLALAGLSNVWEFPLYHGRDGSFHPHSFLDGGPGDEVILTPAQRAEKEAWLAIYASQKRVIDLFPVVLERFRPQPEYDFSHPPHPGDLYYERRKLGWTWTEWRQATRTAIE